MDRVLVTGGCGFIGSHVTNRLVDAGYSVVVLDNQLRGNKLPEPVEARVDLRIADVRDPEAVDDAVNGCRFIVHLAAYLGVDIVAEQPIEAMEVEALGMRNIAHSALRHSVERIAYASTSGVYGKTAIDDAVNEEFSASPSSSYAIAKRFNEIYLQGVHQETGLQSVSLRYFNVYGPRQDERMVIPRFLTQARNGMPLQVYSPGTQTRDFTFIDDTVEATIALMERVEGAHIVNIANGKDESIYSVAEMIARQMDSGSEVSLVDPPPGRAEFEVMKRAGNSDKLERLVGFRPSLSLEEGLARTIAAFPDNNQFG